MEYIITIRTQKYCKQNKQSQTHFLNQEKLRRITSLHNFIYQKDEQISRRGKGKVSNSETQPADTIRERVTNQCQQLS